MVEQDVAVRFVDGLIADAIRQGAREVHLSEFEGAGSVEYLVSGKKVREMDPPLSMMLAVVARLKALALLDPERLHTPQQGGFLLELGGNYPDFLVEVSVNESEEVILSLQEDTAEGFVLRTAHAMFRDAVERQASEVHLFPSKVGFLVNTRVLFEQVPAELSVDLAECIKAMRGPDGGFCLNVGADFPLFDVNVFVEGKRTRIVLSENTTGHPEHIP